MREELKDKEAAKTAYKTAIKYDSKYAPAWYRLGEVLRSSNFKEALDMFQKVVEIDPKHRMGWLSLRNELEKRGETEKAKEAKVMADKLYMEEFDST
jgi:tetratricopeptide (TPR) repeat protein